MTRTSNPRSAEGGRHPEGALKKITIRVAASMGIAAALVGVMHMRFARSLLSTVACPVGRASAAQIEEGRMQAVHATRGTEVAAARPALGFTLDAATREDVDAWAKRHSLTCAEKREGMYLSCRNVPVAALGRLEESGTVDEVSFAFRPRDRRLVNVTATWFSLSTEEASTRMNGAVTRLALALRAPGTRAGEVTPERLGSGGYATATVSYRYSNFMAEVTATSFGDRGVALREHYMSAVD